MFILHHCFIWWCHEKYITALNWLSSHSSVDVSTESEQDSEQSPLWFENALNLISKQSGKCFFPGNPLDNSNLLSLPFVTQHQFMPFSFLHLSHCLFLSLGSHVPPQIHWCQLTVICKLLGGKETYTRRMMHPAGSLCFSGMHLVHTSWHLIFNDSTEMWLELCGSQNLKWEAKQFLGMVVHKVVWVQKEWKMWISSLSSVLSRTNSRRLFFPKQNFKKAYN